MTSDRQAENYCLNGEPCCPDTNLSSSVMLFFSHRFSLLPFCNRATKISKAFRNPVTWTDTFLLTLITDWGLCVSGPVHLCECFLPDRVEGVSNQKHSHWIPQRSSNAQHSASGALPLRNSLTGTNHISLFSLMLRMALTTLPPSTA